MTLSGFKEILIFDNSLFFEKKMEPPVTLYKHHKHDNI